MGVGNTFVAALLSSPLHGLLSGSTDLVRYTGRRSERQFTTPTQYVRLDDDLLILVGRPEAKTWWRNFREERDLDVLLQGRWRPMRGRAVIGADEPETIGPLLDVYLQRFPKAARALDGATPEARARGAVVVRCRSR
jgi:hypothetical protein